MVKKFAIIPLAVILIFSLGNLSVFANTTEAVEAYDLAISFGNDGGGVEVKVYETFNQYSHEPENLLFNEIITEGKVFKVPSGGCYKVTAKPQPGYDYDYFVRNGIQRTNTSYGHTNVREDSNLKYFSKLGEYDVNVSLYSWDAEFGDINPYGKQTVEGLSSLSFTADPNVGYELDYFYIQGHKFGSYPPHLEFAEVDGNVLTINSVTEDLWIGATFKEKTTNTLEINTFISEGGTLNLKVFKDIYDGPDPTPIYDEILSEGEYTHNFSCNTNLDLNFNATPNSGYKLDYIYFSLPTEFTFNSPNHNIVNQSDDVLVEAYFIQEEYTISAVAESGGSISPPGNTVVLGTESQSYTMTPNEGYLIDEVFVDGISMGNIENYVFENVVDNHSIQATFFEKTIPDNTPPILNVPNLTEINTGDSFSYLDEVSASDIEDGDITGDIQVSGSVDTAIAGVYTINYSVIDSDGNSDTAKQVILVNDGNFVVGTNYILQASDFTKRIGQVDTSDIAMKNAAGVKLYDKTTGEESNETVTIVDEDGYTASVGTYDIVFEVANETMTTKTITASVTAGDVPVLDTPSFTKINVNGGFDPLAGVSASDTEDGDITGNVVVDDSVNNATAGVYILNYSVTDNDDNSVSAKQVVLVNDGSFAYDNGFIIQAFDFKIGVTKANISNEEIIELAKVRVYDVNNQRWINNPELKIDRNGFDDVIGKYPVTFAYNPSITITATVYDDRDDLPKTGDSSNAMDFSGLLLVTASVLLVLNRRRKENRN